MEFDKIADTILNTLSLLISKEPYRIAEIEMYLMTPKHPDTFCVKTKPLLLNECIHFRSFLGGGYDKGFHKGCDLTFGNQADKTYFGVLIRSIVNPKTDEFIEGPDEVVREMLNKCKKKNLLVLVKDGKNWGFSSGNGLIEVRTDNELEKKNVFKGPRVGLKGENKEFVSRNYRYTTEYKRTSFRPSLTRLREASIPRPMLSIWPGLRRLLT